MDEKEKDSAMPIALTLEPGVYFRCTCGCSQSLPFCDGHHQQGQKLPLRFEVKEREKVYLCTCGQSRNLPHCDGSCGVDVPVAD
ncbi:CDGSH iron-sulfur domain-containing protein [Pelobacter seleniigenes]|uniref:CDGSH iron-sulfur domain-containing protein n=1 Tax=Pelobacter seleniigenes TaxID=407188 RepID=UPI000A035960|nr:CDGSH iron-sulfur domain-containing protein [Pelobacter seleniigenes]